LVVLHDGKNLVIIQNMIVKNYNNDKDYDYHLCL
jgi:hypothetical protein